MLCVFNQSAIIAHYDTHELMINTQVYTRKKGTFVLAQDDANRLMDLGKIRQDDNYYAFPGRGQQLRIPIVSIDYQEHFELDMYRGRIVALKCSYHEQYQGTPLVRLDMNPSRHTNPFHLFPPAGFEDYNGVTLTNSHVHLYREGFGDRYAIPAERLGFKPVLTKDDLIENLSIFFDYCNIVDPPFIQEVLI
jgi:hypothetical protein